MQLPENFGTILRKILTFHFTLKIFSPSKYGVRFDFVWKVTVKLQYFDKYAGWGPSTSAIKPPNIMPNWSHGLAFKKRAKNNAIFQQYYRNISATSTCVLDIKGWPLRKGQKKRARYFHTGQLPFKNKCTFLSWT